MEDKTENPLAVWIERIEHVFLRLVSLALTGFAIQYWMRVTGIGPAPEIRFDTLPQHWQAASAAMAILMPVAALGLWGLNAWGVVMWVVAAVAEIVMHGLFPGLYGADTMRTAFHLGSLALLAVLYLGQRAASRRRRVPG